MGPCATGPIRCGSERLPFCGCRPITRLAGAGSTWVVNFFSKSCVHCINLVSVLHLHAYRTAHFLGYIFVHCIGIIFLYCFSSFVSFFLSVRVCTAFVIVLCCRCTHLALRASFFVPKSTYCTSCTHIVNYLVRIWRTAHIKWSVDYNFLEYYFLMICGFVLGNF